MLQYNQNLPAEFQGKLLYFTRPGSRPHESLSIRSDLREDSPDLRLETHILSIN